MIRYREDCRWVAFLYANDMTHMDKPACLKGHGSWPNDWECDVNCYEFKKLETRCAKHELPDDCYRPDLVRGKYESL